MFSGCVQIVTCYFMVALHIHKSVVLKAVNILLINKIVNLYICFFQLLQFKVLLIEYHGKWSYITYLHV